MAETLAQRHKRLIGEIRKLPVSDGEKNRLRASLVADIQRRKSELVGSVAREERISQNSSVIRRVAGSVAAGVLNAVDTATLGHLPEIAGLVAGPESQQRLDVALGATEQVNPVASGLGDLGGLFTGPAGAVARGGSRLGAGALNATPGLGQLVARGKAASQFTPRAAAQLAQNLATGAGALTGIRLLEDSDKTIGARLSEAADEITSPTNLVLSGGLGAVAARFGSNQGSEIQRIARKWERITGEKVPADVLTDRATLQQFMDQASQNPVLANDIRKVRNNLIAGMGRFIDQMAKRQQVRSEPARAGGAVRDLQSRVTEARRAPQRAALATEGGNRLSDAGRGALRSGLAAIRRDNVAREDTSAFTPVVRKLLRLTRDGRAPTVNELEALRKMTANVAFTKAALDPRGRQISGRSQVEARRFYQVLDQAFEASAPEFSRALRAGERLRRMEEALPPNLPKIEVDDVAMARFFRPEGLLGNTGRWRTLTERGAPEEVAAAKGWLFHSLVSNVTGADGMILESSLQKALRGQGAFNKQTLDKILPGLSDELMDAARLSTAMRRGIMAPRGSQTASRSFIGLAQQSAPFMVTGTIAGLLANPYGSVATLLGVTGSQVAITAALRSLVSGRGQDALRRAATGQTQGLTFSPVVLDQIRNQVGAATGPPEATGIR